MCVCKAGNVSTSLCTKYAVVQTLKLQHLKLHKVYSTLEIQPWLFAEVHALADYQYVYKFSKSVSVQVFT